MHRVSRTVQRHRRLASQLQNRPLPFLRLEGVDEVVAVYLTINFKEINLQLKLLIPEVKITLAV